MGFCRKTNGRSFWAERIHVDRERSVCRTRIAKLDGDYCIARYNLDSGTANEIVYHKFGNMARWVLCSVSELSERVGKNTLLP